MTGQLEEQVSLFDPDSWSGKMSPERSAQTVEKTLPQSSKKRSKSSSRKLPLFLCLRKAGPQADASLTWTENGALRGEYTMHGFGECPSAAVESRLSAILEDSPHPKYCLSAKACLGILNRAKKRGKKLPEALEAALLEQAELTASKETASTEQIPPDATEKSWTEDVCYTLNTIDRSAVVQGIPLINDQGGSSISAAESAVISPTLRAEMHGNLPIVAGFYGNMGVELVLPFDTTQITSRQNGSNPRYGSPCHPLAAGAHPPTAVIESYSMQGLGDYKESPVASTCKARNYKDLVAFAVDCRNGTENPDVNGTLQAKSSGGQSINLQNTVRVNKQVRFFTPLECERLQGYPDKWTDIPGASDSARYKALGNSIALPFWFWLLRRISAIYERPATLGSLFDGIGGFPLCWERCNGKGTALWASEIEKFPIAVTKFRFGEEI